MSCNTLTRRAFLARTAQVTGCGIAASALPLPAWASPGSVDQQAREYWSLRIGETPVRIDGRAATATGINGTVPGPLIRLKEGMRAILEVRNELREDSSIHWHGLILPSNMDGVPGLSFAGIRPAGVYRYAFDVRQHGTYWYHSHSGLQEQTGIYGPLIVDPAGKDPVDYDREFVILLSDWTFSDPRRILANLKKMDHYYNRQQASMANLDRETGEAGLAAALADRAAWAQMRMTRTDIADVTGETYTYLMNGRDAAQYWSGLFEPGERVRLRVINGSAMSFFNVRVPGLPMTIVQADGQDVEPVEVDEFQVGTAETYDVVVTPGDRAYTIMAEAMDRSGFVRGTLTPEPGLEALVPPLREAPLLGMADMGMDHGDMSSKRGESHEHHGHRGHGESAMPVTHEHRRGPGVASLNMAPLERLDHPGIGLDNVGHRTLRYSQLRALVANTDERLPGRTLELHLTGNMHRYMWSFDGVKFSEVKEPIRFDYGERLRMVLVNDTMMAHPIHLHGMFVELVNGNDRHNPRKHTVVVKPAERLTVDVTADQPGKWAFHCHLLYHMKAGMMRVVVIDDAETAA